MCLDPSLAVTWGLASSIALKLHGMGLAAVLSYQNARHFLEAPFTCVLYHEPLLIRVWCPSHEEIINKYYFLYTDQVLYWIIVVPFLFSSSPAHVYQLIPRQPLPLPFSSSSLHVPSSSLIVSSTSWLS